MANTFVKLATASPNAASVTFSGISQNYDDLAIFIFGGGARSDFEDWLDVTLDSQTGIYWSQGGTMQTSYVGYSNQVTGTKMQYVASLGAVGSGTVMGGCFLYFTNYSSATKTKHLITWGGGECQSTNTAGGYSGRFGQGVGATNYASAVSSITLTMNNSVSGGFRNGSVIRLYGIKNA